MKLISRVPGKRTIDIVGMRFTKLKVVSFVGVFQMGKSKEYLWSCICDCGAKKEVSGGHLRNGKTLSCGCFRKEIAKKINTTHGGTLGRIMTPEYKSWLGMKQRCNNPRNPSYSDYGGRGISVCESWNRSYESFLRDMGARPANRYSIDRRDNNGDYCPSNCYWATDKQQARNRRSNRKLLYHGKQMTVAELSEIKQRSYKWVVTNIKKGKLNATLL